MTQITKNATFTDLLQVGEVLTVTASNGGQALVHLTSPSGTFSQSNTTGTLSFGPYNFDQRYAVTCTSGVVDIIETTQDQSQLGGAGATESLSGPRTITALDDQKQFTCTTALPIMFPNGLSPRPSVIAVPPATGNLTLTPTGGATLNGSASSITRTFANNRLGVAITPNPYDVNDYTVSGS